jgi:hypothetical protein
MSGVVLWVACRNLANMLLARGAARQKEFAIRAALGGGRWQIVRQLLADGLLLAVMGGALALLITPLVAQVFVKSLGTKLPFMTLVFDPRPDLRLLAATFGFCVIATLLSTAAPALKFSKIQVMHDLREQGGEGGRPSNRLYSPGNLLVIGQLGLSFVLLTVAGLFLRGALKAADSDPGFRFEQGLLAELDVSLSGYDEIKARVAYEDVLAGLRALPAVEAVSMASSIPFGIYNDGCEIHRPGFSERIRRG